MQPDSESIFHEARELSCAGERLAYLDAACAGNDTLRAELDARLAEAARADDFFGETSTGEGERAPATAMESPGTRIGRYKLLRQIGEGGFGTVWMAEQEQPIRRRVAVKIIKPGMDTREIIARFEHERQALAMMEHPNIAKVLDAGATERGRPFFVMELVTGVPITRFCDDRDLGTTQRLELFKDVCSAINHAHQKGIIHRDIKPSNVLVALYGERPVVQVIDFGIAKAVQGELADRTVLTRIEQFVGTPVYMSPEQAATHGMDIDTRSDIYSLGVLLYELLTGKPPFDAVSLASAGYEEMRRIIREVEPPRPSTFLKTHTGAERPEPADARRTASAGLHRLVAADLDWIVMKALEKDRDRRYETANGLSSDIQRFLADEPVSATPPTAIYRFRKFARRNKVALRVSAGIAAGLVAATGISLWQAVRAMRAEELAVAERDEKEAALLSAVTLSTFLTEAFQSPGPESEESTVTVAETLDSATRKLATGLSRLASTLDDAGRRDEALRLRQELLPLCREALGRAHPDTLSAMHGLAVSLTAAGHHDAAAAQWEELLALRREFFGPHHPDTVRDMANRALSMGNPMETIRLQQEVLAIRRETAGSEDPDTLQAMSELAVSFGAIGNRNEAIALREELLELHRKISGPEDPETARAMDSLAAAYAAAARLEESLALQEELIELNKTLRGEHPETLRAMEQQVRFLNDIGRRDDMVRMQAELLELRRRVNGPDAPETLGSIETLVRDYQFIGQTAEAVPLLAELAARRPEDTFEAVKVAALQAWFGQAEGHAATSRLMLAWAGDAANANDIERVAKLVSLRATADPELREGALAAARKAVELGKENPDFVPWGQMTLGMAEFRNGRYPEAMQALRAAEREPLLVWRPEARIGTARFYLAMCLFHSGKTDEARELFAAALDNMPPLPANDENPLANHPTNPLLDHPSIDDLVLWLACKEARAMLDQ